jgi:acyl-CoA hydrolase
LRGVEIYHLHTEGAAPYSAPELAASFHTNALFVGANVRKAIAGGEADYIPAFLSEVPLLFRREILPIDTALFTFRRPTDTVIARSEPSVDVSLAAVQMAEKVVAQINRKMPRTHGDGLIHIKEIDFGVEVDDDLPKSARLI